MLICIINLHNPAPSPEIPEAPFILQLFFPWREPPTAQNHVTLFNAVRTLEPDTANTLLAELPQTSLRSSVVPEVTDFQLPL